MYFTNLNFGEIRSKNNDWFIEIDGVLRRKDSSIPWTRAQMRGFWRQICSLMRSYGITNRYPLGPLVTLKRVPKYRYKHILTTANHGLQVFGPVKKQSGCWNQENCVKFREEVSTLMRDQGLILSYRPTVWYMTSAKG